MIRVSGIVLLVMLAIVPAQAAEQAYQDLWATATNGTGKSALAVSRPVADVSACIAYIENFGRLQGWIKSTVGFCSDRTGAVAAWVTCRDVVTRNKADSGCRMVSDAPALQR